MGGRTSFKIRIKLSERRVSPEASCEGGPPASYALAGPHLIIPLYCQAITLYCCLEVVFSRFCFASFVKYHGPVAQITFYEVRIAFLSGFGKVQ